MAKGSFEVDVQPEVLKWARTSIGKKVPDVSEEMRIETQLYDGWENGTLKPTMAQVKSLAKIFKRPLAVFFLPEPPIEPPLPEDFRTLPDESKLPLTEKTRLSIRRARRLQSIAMELEDELPKKFDSHIRRYTLNDNPETVASEVREILGITWDEQYLWKTDTRAIQTWRRSIENLGVLVLQLPMDVKEVRAFSLSDDTMPVIVINSRDFVRARIFSLMHEFGHLLMKGGGVCIPSRAAVWDIRDTQGDIRIKKVEVFCNHFAGAILVPRESLFKQQLVKHTDNPRIWPDSQLKQLSEKYRVSKEVILRRLLTFRKTTREYYNKKHEEWAEKDEKTKKISGGGGKGRNMPRECVSQNGTPFVSLVLDSYKNERITYSDVSDYLGVKVKHIPKIEKIIEAP